jgi:V/A-type H+/Na+-transporting ATPase subunit E
MPLEKLIQRILVDAREYADGVVNEAKLRLLERREKAEEDAKSTYAEIMEAVRRELEQEKQQRITAATLQGRQEVLTEKRRLIQEVLERVLSSILSLPPDQYQEMLSNELFEVARDVGGELLLSREDRRRLGEELVNRTNQRIKKAGGAGVVTLSPEAAEITGGFILRAAGVDTNCSFDARIRERRDEIEEKIVETLFSGQP